MSVGEAITVFEDRGDTECGRWFDDEAGVVEEHRMSVMIDASWTRTASSATTRRSSRTAGMGWRPAKPLAIVLVESV